MTIQPVATTLPMRTLRDLNRLRVVDELRRHGTASRSDLARWTGLSRSTVAVVVADLQGQDLLVESIDHSDESPGRGRPPGVLTLNPSVGAVIGVDFDHRHVHVAVADLLGNIVAERVGAVDVDTQAQDALDLARELVEQTLAEADVDRARVIGAGMGLPGPIDRHTGTVGRSVVLPSWTGMKAGDELARRIGIPVHLDNDANLGALAEVSFGAARGLDDVLYVKASSGVGAGLVLGGRIYHGHNGIAGEIGHVQVESDGALCRCGRHGCLETVAGTGPLLALLAARHGKQLTLADALELLAEDDVAARDVFGDAGRAIGRVLASMCNVLNPAAIVVGGELSGAGNALLDGAREAIERYAQPGAADVVAVLPGILGPRAEVLGALALVSSDPDRIRAAFIGTALAATHGRS